MMKAVYMARVRTKSVSAGGCLGRSERTLG